MNIATKRWLYGLGAGFIGGGAGAVGSGIATRMVEPGMVWWHSLLIMFGTFLVTGATHAFAYLQQAPLPAWDGMSDRRNGGSIQTATLTTTETAPTPPPAK